jgi:multiple sugar transport system permease protein
MSVGTARRTLGKTIRQGLETKKELRTALEFWGMAGPLVLGLVVFTFIPIIWGFLISLHDSRGNINLTTFIGLKNYVDILGNPEFIKSLGVVIRFAVFIVPTTFAVSLFLAVLVQNAAFGRGFFRSVFFIPTAISFVIASMIWRMSIFNGLPYGLANAFLWVFGIDSISWINTVRPPWFWLVLVTVRLWLQVGFYMILFVASMQSIPGELYEAAKVDGAESQWTLFWRITFPLLRNTSIFVLLINIIHAFNAFAEFFNILGGTFATGGLLSLARPPLVYLYQIALSSQEYGRGTAGAFILAALIISATLIQNKVAGGLGKEKF